MYSEIKYHWWSDSSSMWTKSWSTSGTLWVSCFNEGCKKICKGLFNAPEILMSTCICKQNRGRWRLQMLIYGAVSIALYRDMDEFDCVHTFSVLSDMFMYMIMYQRQLPDDSIFPYSIPLPIDKWEEHRKLNFVMFITWYLFLDEPACVV